ncbi:MAG TPA: formate dehydrogenase accessory sulfurtransferase FdhD [Anaerolineae bacterium]|nr:formate dehydrogenase accessory sulfurtransferase FdhD [Anaerolineae bacterium]
MQTNAILLNDFTTQACLTKGGPGEEDSLLVTGKDESVNAQAGMMDAGSVETEWNEYHQGWRRKTGEIIGEEMVTIYVNGLELATMMCTPQKLDHLGLGFLKNEGFIEHLTEVDHVHIGGNGCCVDIWLTHAIQHPNRRIITSGCGSGVTFLDPLGDLESMQDGLQIAPEKLISLFNRLHIPGSLHARARGVHTAGLTNGERLLVIAEDVGRHNTIDKLAGACLVDGLDTRGLILLTTGRVSSEMLRKGVAMGCSIIASRNSPTSLSVRLAEAAGITLVGYARQGRLRAFTHAHRLTFSNDNNGTSAE